MMLCFVALSAGCVPAGDFCAIAVPDVYSSVQVAEFLVVNDPDHIRKDLAENEYGKKHCGWAVVPLKGE